MSTSHWRTSVERYGFERLAAAAIVGIDRRRLQPLENIVDHVVRQRARQRNPTLDDLFRSAEPRCLEQPFGVGVVEERLGERLGVSPGALCLHGENPVSERIEDRRLGAGRGKRQRPTFGDRGQSRFPLVILRHAVGAGQHLRRRRRDLPQVRDQDGEGQRIGRRVAEEHAGALVVAVVENGIDHRPGHSRFVACPPHVLADVLLEVSSHSDGGRQNPLAARHPYSIVVIPGDAHVEHVEADLEFRRLFDLMFLAHDGQREQFLVVGQMGRLAEDFARCSPRPLRRWRAVRRSAPRER